MPSLETSTWSRRYGNYKHVTVTLNIYCFFFFVLAGTLRFVTFTPAPCQLFETMAAQVARAFAQSQAQDPEVHRVVDDAALEWHKARIAYLEGVRADMARQLENGQ